MLICLCVFVFVLIAHSAFSAFIWRRFCILVIDKLLAARSLQTVNVVVSSDALHYPYAFPLFIYPCEQFN